MLWQFIQCPQPPSHSHQHTAEVEHRLPTMDGGVEDCCASETDAFSLPPDDPQVPLAAKELEQTCCPNHEALIWATKNCLIEKQYRDTSKVSKYHKPYNIAGVDPVKAKRSQPRILALLVCISYLLFHFMGADLGVRLINGYIEPRLHQAEVQLQAATSGLVREQLLHLGLDCLLGTKMGRCYMESYENCLVRGLHEADAVFLGVDFTQYPDIRNQTIEWITSNCGRILYTPQLFTPGASEYWMQTVNRFWWLAEKAFELFRYKTALLGYRWSRASRRLAIRPAVENATCKTANLSKMPAEMPFGFTLECEGPPCRLVYSGAFNSTTESQTLKQALAKAHKEIKKWTWSFEKTLCINSYTITLLSLLQILVGSVFLFAIILSRPQAQHKLPLSKRMKGIWPRIYNTIAHLQEDEQLAVGMIINTALYALLYWNLEYLSSEFDRPLLPVGAGLCAFHVLQILIFLDPVSIRKESMCSFWRSIEELYLIAQGHNPPRKTPQKRSCFDRKSTRAPAGGRPASMVALRFISPITSILEDIQQERKVMHADQGKQPRAGFNHEVAHVTEFDSEHECDLQHASYVDLAGDAAPTVLEDGSDWSVVED